MNTESTTKQVAWSWSEADLASGLSKGDADAGVVFVTRAHDAVYAFACRCTRDRDLRQDWTHDVLLRVMSDVRKGSFVYRRPGSFWAWFRTRAWFLILEAGRRERVRAGREPLSPDGETPECEGDDDSARDVEEREAAEALAACLSAMGNPDQAHALRLRAIEGLPYQQIATIMNAPLNTVRAWIRRGRVSLRRCLTTRFGWSVPEEES